MWNKTLYICRCNSISGGMMGKNAKITALRTFQPDILAIQSAVMIGAVGNDAAMPVYNHFRHKVARLDTVRLTAHPGFGDGFADITGAKVLSALLTDFAKLQKDAMPKAVQTGYFGSADQIFPVADFIKSSQKTDDIFYLLDPVLGDAGKIYVDQAIADAMQEELVPLADMITPNAFELGLLVSKPIHSLEIAEQAGHEILGKVRRLRAVFATGINASLPAGESRIADILITREASIPFIYKSKTQGVSGSGDVLSAMFLAGYLRGGNLVKACQGASNIVNQMIRKTATPLGLDVAELLWRLMPNDKVE